MDSLDDSMDKLLERLKDLSQRAVLPNEVVALITNIVLDKMSYSNEVDLAAYEKATSPAMAAQLKTDLGQMDSRFRMMVCPGGNRQCGTDIVRSIGISESVPDPYRRDLESAIHAWREAMDEVAKAASKEAGVPLAVRYELTDKGPVLAFGYGREHDHHGQEAGSAPLPETE